MKQTLYILIVSLTILCCNLTVLAQRTNFIHGTILNQKDSTPITNAHIINLSTRIGRTSDIGGHFNLEAKPLDTIKVSFIGFETKYVIYYSTTKIIYLKQKNNELETFTVLPYQNYDQFKEAFIKLQVKDTTPKIDGSIFLSKEELKAYDGANGALLSGGIYHLLAKYNSYVIDKNRYLELLEKDKYEVQLAKKFSPQLIQRSTTLTDEAIIKDFIDYCDFTNYFIDHSSDYELTVRVIECYDEYKTLSSVKK